jgi:hypothetical protein
MNAKNRQPLTFDIDRSPTTDIETAPAKVTKPQIQRQQIGARVSIEKYRRLKSIAALEGLKVQELVELAIDQFLTKKLNS